jgi:hypothetical protein
MCPLTLSRPVLLGAFTAAFLATGAAFADQTTTTVTPYLADRQPITSVRPTGVGLPKVGETQTTGANELTLALRSYHDSGLYDRDLSAVAGAAQRYLTARLAARRPAKPAIVLDIDETSLSNYAGLAATNFSAAGTAPQAVSGTGVAIAPTLALYRAARSRGVAVFFITGRPEQIKAVSEANLIAAGYAQGWDGTYYKPADAATAAFKSSTRAGIERRGYDILVNLGDQESDLDGGAADAAFKLPNPFYFIPD